MGHGKKLTVSINYGRGFCLRWSIGNYLILRIVGVSLSAFLAAIFKLWFGD